MGSIKSFLMIVTMILCIVIPCPVQASPTNGSNGGTPPSGAYTMAVAATVGAAAVSALTTGKNVVQLVILYYS
jgi:hypothetical protein